MAAPSYTLYFNDAFNYSWLNRRPGFVEEAYDYPVGWNEFLKPIKMTHDGGEVYIVTLSVGKNGTIHWHAGDRDTVPLNTDERTIDVYYKLSRVSVTLERLARREMAAHGNKDAEDRYVKNVLGKAEVDIVDNLETILASDGSLNANAFDGLPLYVQENPESTATIAGIPQATADNSFWRNQELDMTGVAPAGNLERKLRLLWKMCGKKTEAWKGASRLPTIGLAGEDAITAYEDEVDDKTLHTTAITATGETANLGFKGYKFMNIMLHYTPSLDDDHLFLLNQGTFEFRVHPKENFTMTEWKPVADRVNDYYAQMALSCTLACLDRSRNGLLWGIGL